MAPCWTGREAILWFGAMPAQAPSLQGVAYDPVRDRWRTACEQAGYPGKLFHDFRRSAVRSLERAGVPRSTAMAMVGHKTESIYRRYAIVDEAMHKEAAVLLHAWTSEQKAKAAAERRGQLRRFKQKTA